MRPRKCKPGKRCKPPPKQTYHNVTKTVREWVAHFASDDMAARIIKILGGNAMTELEQVKRLAEAREKALGLDAIGDLFLSTDLAAICARMEADAQALALAAKDERLESELAEARKVIERLVNHIGTNDNGYCPVCKAHQPGHYRDCVIAAALAQPAKGGTPLSVAHGRPLDATTATPQR